MRGVGIVESSVESFKNSGKTKMIHTDILNYKNTNFYKMNALK